MQPPQRGRSVVEGRPVADRLREPTGLVVGRAEAELAAQPAQRPGEDLAVGQVGAGLERCLVACVALEELVLAHVDPLRCEHGLERVEDALLPVDQGAVAVERDRVEAAEVDLAHGLERIERRSADVAGAARASTLRG